MMAISIVSPAQTQMPAECYIVLHIIVSYVGTMVRWYLPVLKISISLFMHVLI